MPQSDYEIVCGDDEPQWHEERNKLITASVAAQLLKCQRFGSLTKTYLRMRGVDDPSDAADEINKRELFGWGHDQQASVVRNIGRRLGLPAESSNMLLRSTSWPWAGCTIDGWVINTDDPDSNEHKLPLEVKTTSSVPEAEAWECGVPAHVDAQVQHQMLVTGASKVLVAAVVFGRAPIFAWVERDEGTILKLIKRGEEFMNRVKGGHPPEPDGNEDTTKAMMSQTKDGETVQLDIEAVEITEAIADLSDQIKGMQALKEIEKQKLLVMMGNAEIGMLPGDAGRWKRGLTKRAASVTAKLDAPEQATAIIEAIGSLELIGVKVKSTAASEYRVLRKLKK